MVDADVELLVDDEDFLWDSAGMDARPGVDELIEWPAERRRFSWVGRAPATLAPTLTVWMIGRERERKRDENDGCKRDSIV